MKLYIVCCFMLLASHQSGASHLDYVTNPHQTDGFGSQFQHIIAAAIYADLAHKQFVYTPFVSMEHNYDDNPEFLAKKETFINFIGNFPLNTEHSNARRDISYKPFFDKYPAACANSPMLKRIKTVFRANKNVSAVFFQAGRFNIAIHVRRPNQHDCRIMGTDTPDTLFLDVITALRTLYRNNNPLFHIYSQGDVTNFAPYYADDVVLHLNESVEDSFLGLVLADVVVTSASSFSYTAALLSEGVVYYIPFWHSPLPSWISVYDLLMD